MRCKYFYANEPARSRFDDWILAWTTEMKRKPKSAPLNGRLLLLLSGEVVDVVVVVRWRLLLVALDQLVPVV